MSSTGSAGAELMPAAAGLDWRLIGRQIAGVLRLELRKNLFSKRAIALYFLAWAPVALVALWAVTPLPERFFRSPVEASNMFAGFFQIYLRVPIYLSALFLFMNLFRAEILEQSLHYYLLTPVRREVLVAGKYLSALVASSATFFLSTAALFLTTIAPWGLSEAVGYLLRGPGLGNLIAYLGVSVLACVGYGAVFLLVGQFFRNPVVPGVAIWAWEFINFLLPPLLKKLSVIHYLVSLNPIPIEEGPFSIVAEPTPAWISIPGLLLFTAAVLVAAGLRARAMEVTYGAD